MKIKVLVFVGLLILPFWAFPTIDDDPKAQNFMALKEANAQKFEVVFTVKYNAMTLAEAAAKEKMFRHLFGDACEVGVAVSEISSVETIGTIEFQRRYWIVDDEGGSVMKDSLMWETGIDSVFNFWR